MNAWTIISAIALAGVAYLLQWATKEMANGGIMEEDNQGNMVILVTIVIFWVLGFMSGAGGA